MMPSRRWTFAAAGLAVCFATSAVADPARNSVDGPLADGVFRTTAEAMAAPPPALPEVCRVAGENICVRGLVPVDSGGEAAFWQSVWVHPWDKVCINAEEALIDCSAPGALPTFRPAPGSQN